MASWKELGGEERYRVVELAMSGKVPMKELCETFGVTRQTLSRAVDKAQEAARSALEPKAPGRKQKSEEELRIIELWKQQSSIAQERDHWKTRYEVAQAYIDLLRQEEQEEAARQRREKKKLRRNKKRKASGKARKRGGGPKLAAVVDGAGARDRDREPAAVEETRADADE